MLLQSTPHLLLADTQTPKHYMVGERKEKKKLLRLFDGLFGEYLFRMLSRSLHSFTSFQSTGGHAVETLRGEKNSLSLPLHASSAFSGLKGI